MADKYSDNGGKGRKDYDTEWRKQAYGSPKNGGSPVPPVSDGKALSEDK